LTMPQVILFMQKMLWEPPGWIRADARPWWRAGRPYRCYGGTKWDKQETFGVATSDAELESDLLDEDSTDESDLGQGDMAGDEQSPDCRLSKFLGRRTCWWPILRFLDGHAKCDAAQWMKGGPAPLCDLH
jgi:hypothetical protein